MCCTRALASVISRQATSMSVRARPKSVWQGVAMLMPPRPAGLGQMLPSISQNALRRPYSVSVPTLVITGRRARIGPSMLSHIAAGSQMCVSASITVVMAVSLRRGAILQPVDEPQPRPRLVHRADFVVDQPRSQPNLAYHVLIQVAGDARRLLRPG